MAVYWKAASMSDVDLSLRGGPDLRLSISSCCKVFDYSAIKSESVGRLTSEFAAAFILVRSYLLFR